MFLSTTRNNETNNFEIVSNIELEKIELERETVLDTHDDPNSQNQIFTFVNTVNQDVTELVGYSRNASLTDQFKNREYL